MMKNKSFKLENDQSTKQVSSLMKKNKLFKRENKRSTNQISTTETINVSIIAVIHFFSNGHLSEVSVIDSKYIKMTGLQDFY